MTSADDIFSVSKIKRRTIKRESRKLSFLFYEAFYGPFVFLKATYRQLLILGVMFVWGTFIFYSFNSLNWISAFLASVSTITTIGLYVPSGVFNGQLTGSGETEAFLLIIMIIVSVGAGASIVQSTVNTVANGDLAKGEAEKRLITKLKNHAIVFGYSHLGRYIAEKFEELGYDYVVLTRDPALYHELMSKEVFAVLEHESQPIAALRAAGVDKASIIVAAHTEDSINMLEILSSRKLRPDIRIVTVVHDQSLVDTAKNAGADVVIPSSVTVGHLLALSAATKDLVGIVFSEKIGTKEIAQFSIFEKSPLIGRGLIEVSKLATVIGVIRNEEVVSDVFKPDFRLEQNDTLLVLGDPAKLQALEIEARAT
jgi:Trk K+ transport system NAD-binding subunit